MPSYSIFNKTTIIVVRGGNYNNMVNGNYHHLDRSTTALTDPNVELGRTVTPQSSLPAGRNRSSGKFIIWVLSF